MDIPDLFLLGLCQIKLTQARDSESSGATHGSVSRTPSHARARTLWSGRRLRRCGECGARQDDGCHGRGDESTLSHVISSEKCQHLCSKTPPGVRM
jgi:hypothetical protein